MNYLKLIAVVLFLLPTFSSNAQNANVGNQECLIQISMFHEFVKQESYDLAIDSWRKAFNECAATDKTIYLDGEKIMKSFIEKAADPQSKEKYIDTLLMVYTQRIQFFGQEGFVYGKMGIDLLKYRPQAVNEAHRLLEKSVELEGEASSAATVATYAQTTNQLFKNGELSNEAVIRVLVKLMNIVEKRLVAEPEEKGFLMTKNTLNTILLNSGASDCQSIIKVFEEEYAQNHQNKEWLMKVSSFLEKLECTESDLFVKTTEELHILEPSNISARNLGIIYKGKENWDKAMEFYLQAVNLSSDSISKGYNYYDLAIVSMQQNKYSQARSYAYEAIKMKPNWGLPYILIGDLYIKSSDLCNSLEIPAAIYWVAVDKYQKARAIDATCTEEANRKIGIYSAYFPNQENVFFYNYFEGNSYNVGCWINETTTVRF